MRHRSYGAHHQTTIRQNEPVELQEQISLHLRFRRLPPNEIGCFVECTHGSRSRQLVLCVSMPVVNEKKSSRGSVKKGDKRLNYMGVSDDIEDALTTSAKMRADTDTSYELLC